MEHRWGQRFSADMPVRLRCKSALGGFGQIIDISMSGAFVVTALRPPIFANLEVALSGPRSRNPPWLAGFVVRHDDLGIGIEWDQFGPVQVTRLLQHAAAARPRSLSIALDQYRRTVIGRAGR